MNKYYITSAIPYVNAMPHIGHALEFIQADTIRRYKILQGFDAKLLSGSDENALKNVQSAEKSGMPTQEFIDKNALLFENLAKKLNVQFDFFQKGSNDNHHLASQKLWSMCKGEDIYKKNYKGLYCLGCEEFKSITDLNSNSECPEHPGKNLDEIEEENYFFALSKYQDQLLDIIGSGLYSITPEFRKNEIISFIKSGLNDFSISRSNLRAKNWGVQVPVDLNQRIYVWFDALNIYQSGIGFGWDEKLYDRWWPADLHVIGKGIIRFHAIYWPAILLSAGLKLPKALFVHEYFTVNGQKMSKTLGNVIDPVDLVNRFGTDALRYYCLSKISPFQDGDFSEDKLKETYNSDLANGLGNLIARVAKLAEKNDIIISSNAQVPITQDFFSIVDQYKFNTAMEKIWEYIKLLDIKINFDEPWKVEKDKARELLSIYIEDIQKIAYSLRIFLPETAEIISEQFKGPKIISQKPLFPRI